MIDHNLGVGPLVDPFPCLTQPEVSSMAFSGFFCPLVFSFLLLSLVIVMRYCIQFLLLAFILSRTLLIFIKYASRYRDMKASMLATYFIEYGNWELLCWSKHFHLDWTSVLTRSCRWVLPLCHVVLVCTLTPYFFKMNLNGLKTKRRPLYLKNQSVPRSKHFSSRL